MAVRLNAKFKEEVKSPAVPKAAETKGGSIDERAQRAQPVQESTKKQQLECVGASNALTTSSKILLKPSLPSAPGTLESDSKRLKEELRILRKENERLSETDKSNKQKMSEIQQKVSAIKMEIESVLGLNRQLSRLQPANQQLEEEILRDRIKLATIFNKAAEIGGSNLTDSLQMAGGYL